MSLEMVLACIFITSTTNNVVQAKFQKTKNTLKENGLLKQFI